MVAASEKEAGKSAFRPPFLRRNAGGLVAPALCKSAPVEYVRVASPVHLVDEGIINPALYTMGPRLAIQLARAGV